MKKVFALVIIYSSVLSVANGQVVHFDTAMLHPRTVCYEQNVLNIIHLTDIHLNLSCPEDSVRSSNKLRSFCHSIKMEYDRSNTFIILSGDFSKTDSLKVKYRELNLASQVINDSLKQFNYMVCPGNHDYSSGVGGYEEEKRMKFNECFNYKDPQIEKVITVGRKKVVFFSVNSMFFKRYPKFLILGLGRVNSSQLQNDLKKYSDTSKYVKIICTHHPADTDKNQFKKEVEHKNWFIKHLGRFQTQLCRRRFLRVLSNQHVSLLLCGHRHVAMVFKNNIGQNKFQIIESPALCDEGTKGYYVATFHFN